MILWHMPRWEDRKSTRLNSSHQIISYAVFCLKKKNAGAARRPAPPWLRAGLRAGLRAALRAGAPVRVVLLREGGECEAVERSLFFFFLMSGGPPSFTLFPSPPLSG